MMKDVTSNLLLHALQAKQRDGSIMVKEISTLMTRNRDNIIPVDGVSSKDRRQGRYLLTPNVQSVVRTSIGNGNPFAALALLVLANIADEAALYVQSS